MSRWRWGSPWLALVGSGLLVVLAAVAWVQYRQVALLSSQVRYEGDNLVWSFVQLESEGRQLRDLLREQLRYPERDQRDALRLRYELFASRLPLVDPSRTQRIAPLGADHGPTHASLRELVARFDPVFAQSATGALPGSQVAALLHELDRLQEPMHDLSMRANQAVANQVGLRNDTVREQSQLSVALTIFQSLLTLAFAAITFSQFRSLQRQRHEQEGLALRFHQARLEAERANQGKTQFLANMSHELRTPLNGMLGMLWLLQRSPLDPQQADQLRTAHESASHLLTLLNDILDISRLESGRVDIITAPLSLHRLLDEVRAQMAPGAQAKGLALEVVQEPCLPDWVLADEQRLRQILFNLMSNALKFCEQGQVSLRLQQDPEAPDRPGWVGLCFVVRDSGIGIDPATMALLFKRFTQGDASTARRYGGSGLGLEISRNLARLMGGDIEVASNAGQGAAFTLRLCLAVTDAPPADATPAPTQAVPTPMAAMPSLDLLVVDDNATNRKFMASLLGRMGHRVRLAEDGAQAVTAVLQKTPDLVLMDLHMPVQDGEQATRALRALPAPVNTLPVVALTADAFAQTRERVLAAGMNGFLSKPVQVDELERLLRGLFGAQSTEQAATSAAAVSTAATPTAPPPATAADASAAPTGQNARRPRAGDLARLLDMATVGQVCLGVGLKGYAQLLQGFFDDSAGSRARMFAALDQAQTDILLAQAHGLKGAAANLGLRALHQCAQLLEQEAAAGTLDGPACAAHGQQLREALRSSQALLQRMGMV